MNYGKIKILCRPLLGIRYQTACTLALTIMLAFVCCLFAIKSLAQGQSCDSVPELVSEVAEEFQAPNLTGLVLAPMESLPPSGQVFNTQQGIATEAITAENHGIDLRGYGSTVDSLSASLKGAAFTSSAVAQTIELRKNVVGCRGCFQVLPQDEVWLVSVRACSCDPENVDLFEVKRLENSNWQSSDLNALSNSHQNDCSRTTMFFIHGNQTNFEFGVTRGFQFYENLFVNNHFCRPPVRLVLWLWKSERALPRLYPDYLVKSRRAVMMGKTLTKTLEALGNRKVALAGFSLGAQVVLSSLEQMELSCACETAIAQTGKYNVALIAPAADPQYICGVAGRSVKTAIVRRSSVIVNSDDRAVKAMRLLIRHECPEAHCDFAQLSQQHCLPLGKTQFFEVSQEISRRHAIQRYTKSPTVQREMCAVLERTAAATF